MFTYSGFYRFYVTGQQIHITLMPEISSISELTPALHYYRNGDVLVSEDGYVELSGDVYWVYYSDVRTSLKDVSTKIIAVRGTPVEQRIGVFSSTKEMFYPTGTWFVHDYTSASNRVARFYNLSVELYGDVRVQTETTVK